MAFLLALLMAWPGAAFANSDYTRLIQKAARAARVNPALVSAVVQVESDFNPKVISKKGAMGLMQLMPETARELGVKNPMNPWENLRGGARYLRKMLDRFGDTHLALAAYNAGPGAVERYRGVPPFPETRNYVRKVMRGFTTRAAKRQRGKRAIYKYRQANGTLVFTDIPPNQYMKTNRSSKVALWKRPASKAFKKRSVILRRNRPAS